MNEDKTSIEKLATMNLEGLLLPEPTPVSYWWLGGLIALVFVLIAWVWAKKRQAPKAIALRDLKRLEKTVMTNSAESKMSTKFIEEQLAVSLRQGFKVTRLDSVMPDNLEWREYLNTLETTLYNKQPSEPQVLKTLITSAISWLRKS